ncbi:hypothetical protein C7B67_20690 [filamentous cyanobacterium Phorm 6]|nr:hypothetical protein C7B67_20690 [filamentous cyanobacterium Phorm 6]
MPENDCILPPTNLFFLAVAGGRSTIQTRALLHPATTIYALAGFPIQQQQLGWRKNSNGRSNKLKYISR